MVPLLADFNQELGDKAEVVKFNCNKDNKELGVSLGIKVAPTFHLYRGETQVRRKPSLHLCQNTQACWTGCSYTYMASMQP